MPSLSSDGNYLIEFRSEVEISVSFYRIKIGFNFVLLQPKFDLHINPFYWSVINIWNVANNIRFTPNATADVRDRFFEIWSVSTEFRLRTNAFSRLNHNCHLLLYFLSIFLRMLQHDDIQPAETIDKSG